MADPPPPRHTPLHKAYDVTNIKAHIPQQLDLDQMNYDLWSELFSTHCIGYEVEDHIDATYTPTETQPNNTPPTTPEWTKLDSIVKSWIYGTITPSLLQNIFQKNLTARQAWLNLYNLFHINKSAKLMQLDNDLRTITLGNMSINEYCTKIKTMADLLANMDSSVPDASLVMYTVNGLPRRWASVAMNIRLRDPPPSWIATRAILLGEEPRLAKQYESSHVDNSSSNTVLYSGGQHSSSTNRRNNNNNRRHDRRSETPPIRYGWVYIPPPTGQFSQPHQQRRGENRIQPKVYYPSHANNNANNSQRGIMGHSPNHRPHQGNSTTSHAYVSTQNSGGPNSNSNQAQQSLNSAQPELQSGFTHVSAHGDNQTPPPWEWFANNQPTTLPQMFNALSLNDPTNGGWVMDTGATDHVHSDSGLSYPHTTNPM